MTQEELKQFLLTIDPKLKKCFWNGTGEDYTVWTPHNPQTEMSDDQPEDVIYTVTINRFTKNPNDTIINQIKFGLDAAFVACDDVITDFEYETGYFHHILNCYVSQ